MHLTKVDSAKRISLTAVAIKDNSIKPGDFLEYVGTTNNGILQYRVVKIAPRNENGE